VALTKRIYLIDCPGVVYEGDHTETDKILKGVLRAEKIDEPLEYIPGILLKAKKEYLQKLYKVESWVDHEDFVSQIAVNYGKLKKGGEPDTKTMAKIILMDWQRGRIPYFVVPPGMVDRNIEMTDVNKVVEEESKNDNNLNNIEEESDDKNKEYGINQDVKEIIITNQYDKKEEN